MTHALTAPAPHRATQPAGPPPADDHPPVTDPAPGGDPSPPGAATPEPLEPRVAELLAQALCQGPFLIQGRFFEITARATSGGQLVVDLRQVNFQAERDPEMRGVVLQVSIPKPSDVDPAAESEEPNQA